MEQFLITYIVQPEVNRFIHHLCEVYDKPMLSYYTLCNTDSSKLRLLSNFPKLHKEDDNLVILDELTYDKSLNACSDKLELCSDKLLHS